jgi:hypothetical protein
VGDLEAAAATLSTVKALNRVALDALVAEATVDCYNDSECVTGFYTMLDDHLAVPFQTEVLGVEVTVTGTELTDDGALHSRTLAAADPDPGPAAADPTTRGHGVDRGIPALVEVSHQDE